MSSTTDAALPRAGRTTADHSETETLLLAWRVHRLREEPRGIPMVAGVYALAFILWRIFSPQPLALILPLVILTGALSDYVFPISYRLTSRGIHADCGASRLFLAWSDVRRASTGADGVFVSPLRKPSRLDAWRGIRLRFSGGNDETVRELVRTAVREAREGERAA